MGKILNAFERAALLKTIPSAHPPSARSARVNLAPRRYQGYGAHISTRAQSQAQNDKSAKIRCASIGPATPESKRTDLPAPCSPERSRAHTHPTPAPPRAPQAPKSAPPPTPPAAIPAPIPADLHAYITHSSWDAIVAALGLSKRTISRLKAGQWPRDARHLLQAWDAYKGRSTPHQSGWFLRRVHPGGQVQHAGQRWAASALATRSGQTIAIARACAHSLLAQTLDMPHARYLLKPLASEARL